MSIETRTPAIAWRTANRSRRPGGATGGITSRQQRSGQGWRTLCDVAARPLRFALTGCIAGGVQLALLALLTRGGWPELPANSVAFLLAAQVNFALSKTFTWRDRRDTRALGRRWLAFHGSIAGMAGINMAVFMLARAIAPTLLASATGIGVAALGNFFIGDRLVFRSVTPVEQDTREVTVADEQTRQAWMR